ncbi:MAG: hypothetical protein JWR07_3596 [Nevskia sp.]|nr:hypothetical protein [Nevskia sp.]
MNIVLLEDDTDAREAMAALLSLDAHRVDQAYDAASFRQVTRDMTGEAVIFDLQLGDDGNGLALVMDYQARRQAAGLGPAKLIALSGSANADHLIASTPPQFPVHHRFVKPADHGQILAALGG